MAQFISSMNLPKGYALLGSSNFTHAGLTKNIELNVQVDNEVAELQEWFNERWEEGVDITEAILQVIENQCRGFSPYDVYLRSMYEYFKSRGETISECENHDSVIYQGLAQYQRDGYNSLIEIANRWSGAFLCDGVGLGKTYVGMMLIERFVKKERKNSCPNRSRIRQGICLGNHYKKYIPEILEGFIHSRLLTIRICF